MNDSILDSTKLVLGLTDDYGPFDTDILTHINSVLFTLTQLGIGPEEGFEITDGDDTWTSYIGDNVMLNPVRTYVYLRVRMLFDPPSTSYHINAIEEQIKQLEWRLSLLHDQTREEYRIDPPLEEEP